jgi:hypothetical protein
MLQPLPLPATAAHSCRALQSRAAALRATRVSADRRPGGVSVHGMDQRQLPTSNPSTFLRVALSFAEGQPLRLRAPETTRALRRDLARASHVDFRREAEAGNSQGESFEPSG